MTPTAETLASMTDHSYPRGVRLLRSADFRRLFGRGRRLSRGPLRLVYLCGGVEGRRFTAVTGRRVGNAVARNRLRRRLRELFRLTRRRLAAPSHQAIVAQPGAAELSWNELRELVLALWLKAGLLRELDEDG